MIRKAYFRKGRWYTVTELDRPVLRVAEDESLHGLVRWIWNIVSILRRYK